MLFLKTKHEHVTLHPKNTIKPSKKADQPPLKEWEVGLGDMGKKMITIIFFISVDIDNYHYKCQIFISFKFKPRILLQSESCRNQTINFP